jgi:NADPH2:quinone reductase
MPMRAAVIERYGEPPVVRDVPEPKAGGAGLVEVSVGALNPADISIASGKFYAGSPPIPYVPGGEGVGRLLQNGKPGPRAFFRALLPNGAFAERAVARDEPVPIPDAVPDGVAAALGTPGFPALLGLTKRARLQKGETVLILAASGVLGTIAIQVARLLGAGRVIAGARDERGLARAKELGADATVDLKQTDGLTERIQEASGGQLHVVLDPVWGIPGAAALEALRPHGRFVQVGQAAGNEAVIKSGIVRGRVLSILGYSNFLMAWEELAAAYRQLVGYAAAGQLKVEFEVLPLEAAPEAWKRQAASPHRKLVLSPQVSVKP